MKWVQPVPSPAILFCLLASPFGWAQEWPETIGTIERYDPAFDALVAPGEEIQVLAGGYEWSEGPVWIPSEQAVLFSDIPNNKIEKWKEGQGMSVFLQPSGFTGSGSFDGREPGTNGLALDPDGHLTMCCHGDRCVKRIVAGKAVVIAERFDGRRFNSPNDLVFHKNGDLYFTDPPYGLPQQMDDPARELDWCGVYRLRDGNVELLTKELTRPNGIGFSPDYATLYVAQSDPEQAKIFAFAVQSDGTLGEATTLLDATPSVGKRKGLPDGMAIDAQGNLWATGPGGVLVVSPAGKIMGRLATGEATANCAFGGADGGTLFITADMYFCRVATMTKGMGFAN